MSRKEDMLGPPRVTATGSENCEVRELLVKASSAEILEVLGGLERAKLEQADIDQFLTTANRDKNYLFFTERAAVYTYWAGLRWYPNVLSEYSGEWPAGSRVVSRRCV